MTKKQVFQDPVDKSLVSPLLVCIWDSISRALLISAIVALLTVFTVLVGRPVFAEGKVFGQQQTGKALVYLIRKKGKQRHVFANEQWLGTVGENSYTFSYLDPGEILLWTDRARYKLVFLSSDRTYYFELERKHIKQIDEIEGRSSLKTVDVYVTADDGQRQQGLKKLNKFQRVRQRAAYDGVYKPCRFAEAKRDEYRRRAESGDINAQHDVATMYWSGECIEQDRQTGLYWYQMAAQNGHGLSALWLGNIYAKGISVPEDPVEAGRWYRIAVEAGDRDTHRLYATRWLEQNDAEYREAKRLRVEAAERDAIEQEKQREARRKQRHMARLGKIKIEFDRLGIAVVSLSNEVRLESPRRKKPTESGVNNRGDNEMTYMLPPEIALGVLAVGWVIGAIETAMQSQLSDADKQQIKSATDQLSLAFADRAVTRELRQRIVDSGQLPSGGSLYAALDYAPLDLGVGRYEWAPMDVTAIVEIEATGMGIVLSEKRYRPARFVMANEMRVIRREDDVILKQTSLCYASRDAHNFSDWAGDDGKRFKGEVEVAYAQVAEDILMILTGEKEDAGTMEARALCAKLEETVGQFRKKVELSGRR